MSTESISEALSVSNPTETVGGDKAVLDVVPATNEPAAPPANDGEFDQKDTPDVYKSSRVAFTEGVPFELLTTERAIDNHSAPIESRI